MRITRDASIKTIKASRSVDAIRLLNEEDRKDRAKKIFDLKRDIDNRVRQKKDITIIIVE